MKRRLLFCCLLLAIAACSFQPAGTPSTPLPNPDDGSTAVAAPTQPIPTQTAVITPSTPPPSTPASPPAPCPSHLAPCTLPSTAQQTVFDELAAAVPPERDDIALAHAYRGYDGQSEPAPPAPAAVGEQQSFNILNHDDNTVSAVTLTLRAAGQHAAFWFDDGPGSTNPDPDALTAVAGQFDQIYEQVTAVFGQENRPGIDGDPRLHIVHVSPLVLCNVTEATAANCGLSGYFGSHDALPAGVAANSNEREMFVMNADRFGSSYYLNVLAHELRHMIEDNYDRSDADWEVEGSAMLAEDLLGFGDNARVRANQFLAAPDQPLTTWTEGNPRPFYGQGYLLNRYLYDRLGPDQYRQFAQHSANGLAALDAIGADGHALWLDWLVAQVIHNHPAAPERYRIDARLDTAMTTAVSPPQTVAEDVHQYAADYYELPAGRTTAVQFTGSTLTPLLSTPPPAGDWIWAAQRANYSQMSLTRPLDLRDVAAATLSYDVYYDIEQGYDYAYVAVSTDDPSTSQGRSGHDRSWQPLIADNMDGLDPADNPSNSALAERFYSGRRQTWLRETVDLSPYAGQVIQIRFEYITDPILTYGGIAVDNITVPEIDFYDSAETGNDGWTAVGFSRVTANLPQRWHLQLVTFPDGAPTVQTIPLADDQSATFTVEAAVGERPPVLIVAAASPMTLEKAQYELRVE